MTGWLDPVLGWFATKSGIPISDYSAQFGGEAIGNGLELIADYFTKGWLDKLTQFGAGALASGYAVLGTGVDTRLRKELLALGTHELFRIVQISPADALVLSQSFSNTLKAMQKGDWATVMGLILKSPAELGLRLPTLGAPPPRVYEAGAPPTPAPPAVRKYEIVEEGMPTGTAPGGRYMVTG